MTENRSAALDAAADGLRPSSALAEEILRVVDLLRANLRLRRALTDTSLEPADRGRLAERLLGERVSPGATALLASAATLDWPSGAALAEALEVQGVRVAVRSGEPETVRSQLGACARLIDGSAELGRALSAHGAAPEDRAALLTRLLGAELDPATLVLVQHAARCGARVSRRIADYEELASAALGRRLARVTVARALPEDQAERLRSQLARIYASPVDLSIGIDPGVLGGVRVLIDDDVIDGTITSTLDQVRRQLT